MSFEVETNNEFPTVTDYLEKTDYGDLTEYVPSEFALDFVTFIKLVNDGSGEENETPIVHYKMLDTLHSKNSNVANMCHRGLGKTTLMGEYLFLYLALYNKLPNFGKVNLAIYVSDSIDNGVKNMRKNLEFRYHNSNFMQKFVPVANFTDVRWEFENLEGKQLIIKGFGAKALSLDTTVIDFYGKRISIKDVKVGDRILEPNGGFVRVGGKSEIFNRPMYKIILDDGRILKVCEDHLHSVVVKENYNNKSQYVKKVLSTKELLNTKLTHTRHKVYKNKNKKDYTSNENLIFIENIEAAKLNQQEELTIDPYLLGLLIGDGSSKKDGSNTLTAHKDDLALYTPKINEIMGIPYVDKRNTNVITISIKGISSRMREYKLQGLHGNYKKIPNVYLHAKKEDRLNLLKGLMDTDGTILKNGRMSFTSNSLELVDNVSTLVRSLGGTAKKCKKAKSWFVEIWINICPFSLPRKCARFTGTRVKPLIAIKEIVRIPDEPSQCISVQSIRHEFVVDDYIRTHNTGVRGTKELGVRPQLAILDDLVSDQDAKSPTVIKSIEDTVYSAVNYALHPARRKMVWSGTPFNAGDPLYKAVESGAWKVNVFPVCEQFPCDRKEFKGSWEDRFNYDFVKEEYDKLARLGKIKDFNQEMMLKIMSDEERLIQDNEIMWYSSSDLMSNKHNFNFFITTDIATSEKRTADFSVVSVWAMNSESSWFWVDGICKKQTLDKTIDDLFRLAQKYKPEGTGIEVSGQQQGFVSWIINEQVNRNIWFPLSKEKGKTEFGIRPTTDKEKRFDIVVPLFKMNKIFFPADKLSHPALIEGINEIKLVSVGGFKSKHDDFLDTISMLPMINAWPPSNDSNLQQNDENDVWYKELPDDNDSYLDSYLV